MRDRAARLVEMVRARAGAVLVRAGVWVLGGLPDEEPPDRPDEEEGGPPPAVRVVLGDRAREMIAEGRLPPTPTAGAPPAAPLAGSARERLAAARRR